MSDIIRGIFKGTRRTMGSIAGSTVSRGALYTLGATVAGGAMIRGANSWRENMMKGLYPGSAFPMESGRFGIRTNRNQAGIDGLKFNFRRR